MSNQGLRQASVRAATGTTYSYEGDWHALFTQASLPDLPFNGRLLLWINQQLGTAYTEINGAMYAFAKSQGAQSWNELGTFSAGGGAVSNGILMENGTDFIMLEDGTSFLLQEA